MAWKWSELLQFVCKQKYWFFLQDDDIQNRFSYLKKIFLFLSFIQAKKLEAYLFLTLKNNKRNLIISNI